MVIPLTSSWHTIFEYVADPHSERALAAISPSVRLQCTCAPHKVHGGTLAPSLWWYSRVSEVSGYFTDTEVHTTAGSLALLPLLDVHIKGSGTFLPRELSLALHGAAASTLRYVTLEYFLIEDHALECLTTFDHLESLSLPICSTVSSGAFAPLVVAIANGNLRHLTKMELRNFLASDVHVWSLLGALESLTWLDVRYSNIDDTGFAYLQSLTALRLLDAHTVGTISSDGLEITLPSMSSLTSLYITGSTFRQGHSVTFLSHLVNLTHLSCASLGADFDLRVLLPLHGNLRTLNLQHNQSVTDTSVNEALHGSQQLTSLNISHCGDIGNEGLRFLREVSSTLQHLLMRNCFNVRTLGFEEVVELGPRLLTLDIAGCVALTVADMHVLSHLVVLESLSLPANITNAGLAFVIRVVSLTSLSMVGCDGVTDDGVIEHLATLVNLRSLDVSYCQMLSTPCVRGLRSMVHLHTLSLEGCYLIDDDALQEIAAARLPIATLNVSSCTLISSKGLISLCAMPLLQRLNLQFCSRVTNSGLVHLSRVRRLTALNVSGCPVTGEALRRHRLVTKLVDYE